MAAKPHRLLYAWQAELSTEKKIALLNTACPHGTKDTAAQVIGKERLGIPDFLKVAAAYGIPGFRVAEESDVAAAIRRALEVDGPALIDFCVEPE